MGLERIMFLAAGGFSVLAAVSFILTLFGKSRGPRLAAETFTLLYLAAMTLSLAVRTYHSGHAPMSNRYESLACFAWSLGFVYWYVRIRYAEGRVGYFLMPLAVLVMAAAYTAPFDIRPIYPSLDTWMFETHVATAFVGYAFFGASFSAAVLFLVDKSEAGKELERLIFRAAYYGFALFTISMTIGGIWAYLAWGTYWLWKVKELWSFLIWIFYAGFIHAMYVRELRGKGVAWLSILGFTITMFTYLGVGIFMKNTHQL